MTKKKHTEDAPQLLQPVTIAAEQLPDAAAEIEVPAGHVYIVALNADGTEKENSGFFYPERSYLRYYGNEAKYSVKKKSTLTIYNHHHYETLYRTSQQIAFSAGRRCNSCGG